MPEPSIIRLRWELQCQLRRDSLRCQTLASLPSRSSRHVSEGWFHHSGPEAKYTARSLAIAGPTDACIQWI
jgi:hypothetical protein